MSMTKDPSESSAQAATGRADAGSTGPPGTTSGTAMSRREFAETFGALALAVTGTIVLVTEAEANGGSILPD